MPEDTADNSDLADMQDSDGHSQDTRQEEVRHNLGADEIQEDLLQMGVGEDKEKVLHAPDIQQSREPQVDASQDSVVVASQDPVAGAVVSPAVQDSCNFQGTYSKSPYRHFHRCDTQKLQPNS